jgi:hypothetical protein
MNREEVPEMHTKCVNAMRTYFGLVEKTSDMGWTGEPMTFSQRFRLMSQGIGENDALLAYLGARSLLLKATQRGYTSSS